MRLLLGVMLFSLGCASFPSVETVWRAQKRVQRVMNLPQEEFPLSVVEANETNHFAIDGYGNGIIYLHPTWSYQILFHEVCHAVQHQNNLPLQEDTCQMVSYILTQDRPKWTMRSH